jgi:hypothetical protein
VFLGLDGAVLGNAVCMCAPDNHTQKNKRVHRCLAHKKGMYMSCFCIFTLDFFKEKQN